MNEKKLVVIEASLLDYQIFDAFCREYNMKYSQIFHNWVGTLADIVQLGKDPKTKQLAEAAVTALKGGSNV